MLHCSLVAITDLLRCGPEVGGLDGGRREMGPCDLRSRDSKMPENHDKGSVLRDTMDQHGSAAARSLDVFWNTSEWKVET